MLRRALLAGSIAGLALAAPASAETAGYTLQVRGHVPVICRATLDDPQPRRVERLQPLGSMSEFCNAGAGYRVFLDHPPGLAGSVYVDGQKIALSHSGSTLISQSATAAKRTRALSLELDRPGSAPASLGLRIAPL